MVDEKPKSSYVNVNTRISRVIHSSMKEYIKAQKEFRFRKISQNQLIIDSLVEKLTREGFMPNIVSSEVIPEDDPSFEEYAPGTESVAGEPRPWEPTTSG